MENKLGVSETVVQRSGEKRLVVEIPDVSDLNQAEKLKENRIAIKRRIVIVERNRFINIPPKI